MKASVVIPSLDGGERFVACATSLAKQKFHEPWEVVVIDSGSRDGSLEQFRQIIEEADIPFTLLEIHQTDFRHGPTRNQAIEASRGEIITLITQDAVPDDDEWLGELTKAVLQDENTAGAFGRHCAHPDHPALLAKDIDHHFTVMAKHPVRRIDNPEEYHKNEQLRQLLHFFSNNNSALRRSVWKRMPFPAVDYGEDQTWAKLALEDGYNIAYAPKAVVRHSHCYGIRETCQRTVTEICFFRDHFGYELTQPRISFLPKACRAIAGDLAWLWHEKRMRPSEVVHSLCNRFGSNLARSFLATKP